MINEPAPHFEAHIRFRTTEEGRRSPIRLSGYRPDLSFAVDQRCLYGAHFVSEHGFEKFGDRWVQPGEEIDLDFWVRSAAADIMPLLTVGSTFRMMEGSHAVADGVITRIYRRGE
jgi:hypothetical protein